MGAISLGLLNGSTWGWGSAKVVACWVVAAAAAGAFVIGTRRAAVPVIDLKMFRSGVFASANIAILIISVIFGIMLLAMSLFLEQSWHWSTITTGLAIAPGPAVVPFAAAITEKLHARYPTGPVVALGFVILAAGQIVTVLTLDHGVHSYAGAILPGWLLSGSCIGIAVPTITSSATHDLPAELSATGSAVINSGRQMGAVFGASILVVILGAAEVIGAPSHFYRLWWVAAALCAPGALASLGLGLKRDREPAEPKGVVAAVVHD